MRGGLLLESGGVRLHILSFVSVRADFVNVNKVIFQQPRPGPPLPKGESYLTIGWKQIWLAINQYKKLPYTFIYIFSFFLLADVGLYPILSI